MSKTKGNVIDPDDLIREYGADPIRFTLAVLASPGSDIPVARERIDGYRAFANKLWNATRFVLMNLESDGTHPSGGRPTGARAAPRAALDPKDLAPVDRWILGGLERLARDVDADLAEFRFDLAANRIYHYIWHEFCDWYIEWVKPDLLGGRPRSAEDDASPPPPPSPEAAARTRAVRAVLVEVLDGVLRLLHPFMPHLTEELWQKLEAAADVPLLSDGARSIVVAPFPKGDRPYGDAAADEEIAAIIGLVQTVRNLRAESGIDPARRIRLVVSPHGPREARTLERHRGALATLARCGEITTAGASGASASGATGPAARGVDGPLRGRDSARGAPRHRGGVQAPAQGARASREGDRHAPAQALGRGLPRARAGGRGREGEGHSRRALREARPHRQDPRRSAGLALTSTRARRAASWPRRSRRTWARGT